MNTTDQHRAVACIRFVRRRSKRLAATVIAQMVHNWICDGCPTGNDTDEFEQATLETEARAWLQKLDARVDVLSPPNAKVSQEAGETRP